MTLPKDACHRKTDALSFDMHRYLCGKLRENPKLLDKLRERNEWFMRQDFLARSMPYFEEWRKALDEGVEAVVDLTLEKSDRGQVLRSCSPFAVIVDQKWRHKFLREWNERCRTYEDVCRHELFESWGTNNPYTSVGGEPTPRTS